MSRTLIVYYSHSGNTKRVASQIQQITNADILRIEPEMSYPKDYSGLSKQAKTQRDTGILPALKSFDCDVQQYDTIIIGTPNWWNTMALPLRTFLSQVDLRGKKVMSFCTHGGGGAGRIFSDIGKVCSGKIEGQGLSLYGSGSGSLKANVEAWIENTNL